VARAYLLLLLTVGSICASPQGKPAQDKSAQTKSPEVIEQEPPEEDEALKPKEYTLNPVEANHDIAVGNYYFKKGKFRSAALRFQEASRWDPGSMEAFLRLGDAREKMGDFAGAREAFKKYLELKPDAKSADAIRKRIEKLPKK
jgi:tetratricopeptide (TPR) repeat protein